MYISEILNQSRGKVVVLKTVSGEEIIGVVMKVIKGVVILKLLGRKIYVAINKIIAVFKRI
ncbi:hypothetical protein ACFPYJ_14780 [Paenibacillus solisilvae]|uniref:DUF2642 domain-containing protein n=1 Tax=Paenibacillus solisilvae TaxID=2486751 RepID=A0ABW0VZB5_9BACL